MASRKVSITEPHPSVPKSGTAYLSGGRGGAGNYKRYKAEDITDGQSATGPASRINLLSKSLKRQGNEFMRGEKVKGESYFGIWCSTIRVGGLGSATRISVAVWQTVGISIYL